MKKLLMIIFMGCFLNSLCSAQDDLYTKATYQKKDSTYFKSDVEKIQFNLGKYHSERQLGLTMGLVSLVSGAASIGTNESNPDASKILMISSGVFAITSMFIYIDAEKWLKNASISISPGRISLNF